MKSAVSVAVALSLCLMPVPVVRAEVAYSPAATDPRLPEKAYVAAAVAAPLVAISYTSGLTTSNVSALPGTPLPHVMDGSSSATAISFSSGKFAVKYNVKTAGTKSGITVDFNDYSTAGQETGNLSGLGNLTVGLTGGAHTVNVRFEDVEGNTSGFQLTQVASSTQRYWVMNLSQIQSSVDLSRIRAIDFYVEPGNTTASYASGTFYLRLNGTDVSAPALPQLDPANVLLTSQSTVTLSGTKEAYSAVYVKGKLVAAADASTTWTTNISLSSEGSNSIALLAKSALGVSTATQTIRVIRDTKAPTGSVKINNGASSTSSANVILNVAVTDAGAGVDSMRFSMDGGKTWTEWEAFAATKSLTLPLKIGTNEVICQVRDRLGNTGTYKDTIVSNDMSALCAEFSAELAALLANPSLSTRYDDAVFQARENFQWKISTYTSSQRTALLAGLSARDQALAKMLFATTQVIAPTISDSQLTSYAKKAPPVTGFTSTDFKNNVTILEGMDPQSVLAFAALLAVPHFKDSNPSTTWASQSWMMAVMDARYNELARRSAVAKVLAQEQVMSVPLRTRVYFTWSGAPDIWISLPSVAITLDDVPALTRLQSSAFEVYRSGATRALTGATAPAAPVLDPSTPTVFGQKTVTISGTKAAYSSVYVNGQLVAPADTSLTWTATVTLSSEGNNTVTLLAKSILGVACATQNLVLRRDTTTPTGSIKINNGASSTGTAAVTLNLTAADTTSGVDAMRFSVDGGKTWTNWEAFAPTRAITLAAGYGTKEVQFQIRDKVGNLATLKDTIVCEFLPATPVVTSTVPAYTNATQLVLSGTKEAQTYLYINGTKTTADFNATSWTATVSLSADGSKTFSVTVKTSAGKTSAAAIVSTIRDRVVPTGSVKINNGAASTGTRDVTLNLTAADALSGVDGVRFTVDGGLTWTNWEAFSATRAITLTSGYATKEVQYQVCDKAGNIATFNDTIVYEFTPSTPVITSPVPAFINSTQLVLSGTKDAETNLYINGTQYVADFYATTWTAVVSLPSDGSKTFSITAKMATGKESPAATVQTVRDTVLPTGSIKINNGDATTTSRDVTLNLTAADSTSGVDMMQFSVDGGTTWTSWEPVLTTKALTLSAGAGTKKVFYQIKDKAGNVSTVYSDTIDYELGVPAAPSVVTVQAGDRRLFVQNRREDGSLASTVAYVAKGVNWSPTSYNTNPSADPLAFQKGFQTWYQTDIPMMAQMGINTVRVYHDFGTDANAIKVLDMLYQYGIKVIVTVDSPLSTVCGDLNNISAVVNAYKNHPAILMWSVGNEWDINRYYGKFSTVEAAAAFTEQAAALIKSLDPNHPVTTAVADSAAAKNAANSTVPSVDVWGINIYRGQSFGEAISQWEAASSKPFYIGEYGADSFDHRTGAENQTMQAQMDGQLWDEVYFDLSAERTDGALVGALAFEWSDEWWKNSVDGAHSVSGEANGGQPDGYNDEEWFGIVDVYRNVKQAYATMQGRFLNPTSNVQTRATPLLTVTSQEDTYRGSIRIKLDDKVLSYRAGQDGSYTGITVAVIDGNTGIRLGDIRTFNTHANYGGNFSNTYAMIDYINNLPNGTVIAVSIADEGGFTDVAGNPWNHPALTQAYQLFESMGSTMVRNVKYRYGWAMIAVKGQTKVLAENFSVYSGSGFVPVTISARLSLTLNPEAGRRTASAAAAIAAVAKSVNAAAAMPVISVTAQSTGVSSVTLNGKTVLRRQATQATARGVQVVAFDPKLGTSSASVRSFDVSTSVGMNALNAYLKDIDNGSVVTMSLSGGIATSAVFRARAASLGFYKTMESLGSTKVRKLSDLGSWAMVAVKGQGVLAESYSDVRTPATIQIQLPEILGSNASKA